MARNGTSSPQDPVTFRERHSPNIRCHDPSRIRPAFVVWILAMLLRVLRRWILLPIPRRPAGWEEIVWAIGSGIGFTTVGAMLVDRRPRESVSRVTFGVRLMEGSVAPSATGRWLRPARDRT